MRLTTLRTAVGVCAIGIASASDAQPRQAGEAGLLLGLRDGRTYWMPRDSGTFRLAASLDHLIVPRSDGWWFAASATRCGLDIDSAHGGGGIGYSLAFVLRYQGVTFARSGATATIALGDTIPCAIAEPRVERERARQYAEALAKAMGDTTEVSRSDYFETGSLDCIEETEDVTFLSPRAVSVASRYRQTEYCAPGGYSTSGSNVVRRLDSSASISLLGLLSTRARRQAARALDAGETCASFDVVSREEIIDTQWIVRRKDGAWIADVWVDGPTACRGGTDVELSLALPRTFTGDAPLPVAWPALVKAYPELIDAVAAPSGTQIALILPDRIEFRRARGGRLAEALGVVLRPFEHGSPAVMIRWATRDQAGRWTRELPRIIPPIVRVAEPKYRSAGQ